MSSSFSASSRDSSILQTQMRNAGWPVNSESYTHLKAREEIFRIYSHALWARATNRPPPQRDSGVLIVNSILFDLLVNLAQQAPPERLQEAASWTAPPRLSTEDALRLPVQEYSFGSAYPQTIVPTWIANVKQPLPSYFTRQGSPDLSSGSTISPTVANAAEYPRSFYQMSSSTVRTEPLTVIPPYGPLPRRIVLRTPLGQNHAIELAIPDSGNLTEYRLPPQELENKFQLMYPNVPVRLLSPLHPHHPGSDNFRCPFPTPYNMPCNSRLPDGSMATFEDHLNNAHPNWDSRRSIKCHCGCQSGPVRTHLFIMHVHQNKFRMEDMLCRLCGDIEVGLDKFGNHLQRCRKLYMFKLGESEWKPHQRTRINQSRRGQGRRLE